jgi:hypothetical protein
MKGKYIALNLPLSNQITAKRKKIKKYGCASIYTQIIMKIGQTNTQSKTSLLGAESR